MEVIKIDELRKELMILDTHKIEPNYTELGRRYKMDYRTIKKYHEGYRGKSTTRSKVSILDQYYDEIKGKLNLPGAKIMSTYQYFNKKYENIGKYHNFVRFVNKHKLKPIKTAIKPHPRFETPFGKQLQFDWKEDVKMTNKYGELFQFNVFSAILSTSRMHVFIYSKYRTAEDVERCLIKVYEYLGGITEEALTDNMSSIVNNHRKKFTAEFLQFCKDLGITPKKCKKESPQTKGKDESSNRFVNWLVPYNNEFETEEDIINILAEITKDVNTVVNSTTGVTPIMLFEKEKEHLKPLPNKKVLDSYLTNSKEIIVPTDFLIYYRGSRYSVSPKFIGKKITFKEVNNKLHMYYNNDLISTHDINNKRINYNPNHYMEGLSEIMPYKTADDVNAMALENLKLFDNLTKEGNK